MKRRNPPPSRGLVRIPRALADDSRTPGRMLFDFVMASPLTGEPKIRMLERVGRLLTAEARAGLWSTPRR